MGFRVCVKPCDPYFLYYIRTIQYMHHLVYYIPRLLGANSDYGAHGASSNGYGSDFTRQQQQQQQFTSQNQFHQPQTYGTNQEDESQGRWAPPG